MKRYAWALALLAIGCNAATLTRSGIEGTLDPVTPAGWALGRNVPDTYDIYLDAANSHEGERSLVLVSTKAAVTEFASFSQRIDARDFAGKRVRFSGYIKSKLVKRWAGLWFRVDTATRQSVAIDNMEDRPITGTNDWTRCEIVLDVPDNAAMLLFGLLLEGTGEVWLDECALEVVGDDVKSTGMFTTGFTKQEPVPPGLPTSPNNMSFEG
jgi:hypothetical protein